MPETIELASGEVVTAQEVEFDILKQPWAKYRLSTGETVRVRVNAARMFRVLDDEGEPAFTPSGEPWVVVRHTTYITASQDEGQHNDSG